MNFFLLGGYMLKNTGIQYEVVTQRIFNALLNHGRENINTIEVRHDVTLIGKSTSHQIDVYWEFKVGGIEYATVVQAKDWARPVEQGELLKFKGVLDDLPNRPRGIFVTRTGYQEGAYKYAQANGILLFELREPTEDDKHNRIMRVKVSISAYFHHTENIHLIHDEIWRRNEAIRLQLSEVPRIQIQRNTDEIMLYAQSGEEVTSLKHLTDSFYPKGMQELQPIKVVHRFEEPTFIETDLTFFPRLKVNEVEAIIAMYKVRQEIQLVAEDIVGFILKNIIQGTENLFDKQGKALK